MRVYLECPWKYKLMYVDGRRPAPTPRGTLGVTLHRTLEHFLRARSESWEELLDCYDEHWLGSGYTDRQMAEDWRRKGERMLKKWLDQERERRSALIGVEREFVYSLGRHAVRGMIDRIDRSPDGKIEIIDYKTQFDVGPGDPAPASPAESLQLRFYALGAREFFSLEPELLSIQYLAAGRRETSAYDRSGEGALRALIQKTADAIERADWPPDASFCPSCEFSKDCGFSAAKD